MTDLEPHALASVTGGYTVTTHLIRPPFRTWSGTVSPQNLDRYFRTSSIVGKVAGAIGAVGTFGALHYLFPGTGGKAP